MTDQPIKIGARIRTTKPVSTRWPSPWTAPTGTLGTIDSGPLTPDGDRTVHLDGDPSGFPIALGPDEFEAAG